MRSHLCDLQAANAQKSRFQTTALPGPPSTFHQYGASGGNLYRSGRHRLRNLEPLQRRNHRFFEVDERGAPLDRASVSATCSASYGTNTSHPHRTARLQRFGAIDVDRNPASSSSVTCTFLLRLPYQRLRSRSRHLLIRSRMASRMVSAGQVNDTIRRTQMSPGWRSIINGTLTFRGTTRGSTLQSQDQRFYLAPPRRRFVRANSSFPTVPRGGGITSHYSDENVLTILRT